MNALVLASYILRANARRDDPARFIESEARLHESTRRQLRSLAASAAGVAVLAVALAAL